MSHHCTTLLVLLFAASPLIAQQGTSDRSSLRQSSGTRVSADGNSYSNSRPIAIASPSPKRRTIPSPDRTDQVTTGRTALPPPAARRVSRPQTPSTKRGSADRALLTVGGSLAVVLGAFFLVVWVSRKTRPRGLTPLPGEVVELLGRAPLVGRQQTQLLRVGRKLVLVSITPTGVEPITEITEPHEVDRLAALCQQGRPGSVSETFRGVLSQYGAEPTTSSFVGR